MSLFRDRESGLPSSDEVVEAAMAILQDARVEFGVTVRRGELVNSYEAKYLEVYFGQLVRSDPDKSINERFRDVGEPSQLARDFRDQFLYYKEYPEGLCEPLKITVMEARRMVACLTLENLAQHAKERFKLALASFGRAVPESSDAHQHRKNVDFWANASQIIGAAFEMKEDNV